jgi:Histidine-specific methyltransferase, SAM-dependent
MKIESLLTELEIAQEFAEALQARDLPEKFLYWWPRSVREYLALSQHAPQTDFLHSWTAVAAKAAAAVQHFGAAAPLISFGAGHGARDRQLLDALAAPGRERKYFPVDASMAMLETACAAAEDAEIETLGIKADISSPMHLVLASDAAESPKLLLMVGNTIAGFDPLDQVRHLSQCLHEGDRLILDGEIYDEGSLARHDNALEKRFTFGPLAAVGLSSDDGEVRFEEKRDERHRGLHLITRHFRAGRDCILNDVPIERGERIGLNFQYLFTPQTFRWMIEKHAKLKILEEIPSPKGEFLTVICAKA